MGFVIGMDEAGYGPEPGTACPDGHRVGGPRPLASEDRFLEDLRLEFAA